MTVEILTPVGRLVGGSLYKANDKNGEGQPLLVKSGPNAGQPRVEYVFGIAIPKQGEAHWNQTAWGQKIWQVGATAFPQVHQAPVFAWKVKDGDSQIPNTRGRKPCENEGWPGHWVLFFSGGFAPKVMDAQGKNQILEPDVVKPGHYIQVFGTVAGNGSSQRPGVYLNHQAVAHSAWGAEIQLSRDFSEVGFGQGVQLPPGASTTPIAAMQPPPAAPGAYQAPPPAAPPAQTAVAPNPGFLQTPPPPVAPPAAPPARVMTAKAAGATYQSFRDAGWSDEQMIQQGYLQA